MNRRTESYWEKWSISRISAAEKRSIPYIKQVQRVYKKAAKDTIESVRAMYRAYYKNDKTFDMDALNGIAPQGDVKRFLAQMKAKGLSTYLPDNYKGRMTRLELINAQIWGEVKKASVSEKIATTELYEKVFENSYYQTGFDMAKGLGENIAFSTLDKATVEKVLSQKFEGEDFSSRIWNNTDRLANQLTEIMVKAIATGASVERTSREFRERFGVGISNATRLVRTETCYFENSAELAAYAEMGIEEFVFVAKLDNRTSDICQSMDGQKFKMSKAMVGENVPPLHPNCRSTIVAYLGKEYEPETRIYRDQETGRNVPIRNMNYAQWKETIENSYQEGIVAGVKLGKPMSFNQANSGKVNPNYGKSGEYSVNCQTCVVAYELRRRGYGIEALPKSGENKVMQSLAKDTNLAWLNKDGSVVTKDDFVIKSDKTNKHNNVSYFNKMKKVLEPNARYTMRYYNKHRRTGHIMNIDVDGQGKFLLHDEQVNKKYSTDLEILSYLRNKVSWDGTVNGLHYYRQPEILRVDDKEINYNIVNKVVKKARKK